MGSPEKNNKENSILDAILKLEESIKQIEAKYQKDRVELLELLDSRMVNNNTDKDGEDTKTENTKEISNKESELAEIDMQEKEALTVKEYVPKNVVGYLPIPNKDGSFPESVFSKDPNRGNTFYKVEDLGNNKFALCVWNNKMAVNSITSSPELIANPVANIKNALNQDAIKITITNPAIYRKENGKFVQESKMDWYYDEAKLSDKETSMIKEKFNALRKKVEEKYDGEEKITSKTASNENAKINLVEKLPSKIEFYLSTPNSDGSFNKSSARTEYIEGASLYAFQRLRGNKYEVYINPNSQSYKLMMSYPDKNIDPVFETVSAFNPNAKDLQTIEPAIVELENGKFKLISKGQMDFDKAGIERENNNIEKRE